jgi:hypothetical protein
MPTNQKIEGGGGEEEEEEEDDDDDEEDNDDDGETLMNSVQYDDKIGTS